MLRRYGITRLVALVLIASAVWFAELYYSHYAHLVAAVNILPSSDIKEHHPERVDELMKVFCRRIAHIYG